MNQPQEAEKQVHPNAVQEAEVFVEHEDDAIRYKTLSWKAVAFLMIAEIVSNGMLSLPASLAQVGIVPAVVIIVFLGIFALYTSKLLINFIIPCMGDAGYLMWGPFGREVLALGTIMFAIAGTGSQLLSGQQALSTLSNHGLCGMLLTLFFAIATFLLSLPRTLDSLRLLALLSVILITLSGILAMAGAGSNPVSGRTISITKPSDFYHEFLVAITSYSKAYLTFGDISYTFQVFAFARHFMFFILISEMRVPQDAWKSAIWLQGFATAFYVIFSLVIDLYIGDTVQSPALFSLPPIWSKITFGIALPNFLFAGGLYSHTAAKLVFVRLFRHTRHVHQHTLLGWSVWIALCFIAVLIAFVFAIAVPIFSYLIGLAAALFASWYTYGIAGFFYLHDTPRSIQRRQPSHTAIALLTILTGAFICVAGTYTSIKLIADAYASHSLGEPFSC